MISRRVQRLREQSVDTRPFISTERAELITRFHQSGATRGVSVPVGRALGFQYLMEHKAVYLGEDELIVGERGPTPKATPTYPELCCHGLEDLEIMNRRDRTKFLVSRQVRDTYRDQIIPYWSGKTMRDRVFGAMSGPWHEAFEAGVFTEFMEQRSPGHAILDDKIYRHGFLDFKKRIAERLAQLDFLDDPRAYEKREQLDAMAICAEAIITFAVRHAAAARQRAGKESDPARKAELLGIAEVCSHVPAHAPRTFHEALQSYWFVHLGVITELNTWDSFNPGRLDQHLWPFYQREREAGTLTREQAEQLLQCFWIKFNNQPAPPKVGVTEEQSGTYTDFALINCGGVYPRTGGDAANDVSYLILDVVEQMQLAQPSACIQLSKKNPNRFLQRAARVIRTGLGQPSVFNADVIHKEMLYDGKTLEDARAGGPSGCVTVSAFGKESCTLTGYCNWPKLLELAMHDGRDPRTGRRIGPATGDPRRFESFDALFEAYVAQLRYFIDLKIAGNNTIERLFAHFMPAPFMSVLMDDCIAKARDYHDGGCRYNLAYIQGVGMGTLADSLAAIKLHVFDRKTVPMERMLEAVGADFAGHEALRQTLLYKTPKYGNDDDYADELVERAFQAYFDAVDGRPNTKGGHYRVNLLPTTVHIYFGQVLGATPNGRLAGMPLSEGISPTQGADTAGPTAVLKSAARIDHARTGGTLLNMRLSRQLLEGDGLDRLGDLVRAYFRMDGHHVQFNVFDVATLRAAQENPEQYRNLIVRVAGYSDCFVDLGRELQEEIISRTEHQAF